MTITKLSATNLTNWVDYYLRTSQHVGNKFNLISLLQYTLWNNRNSIFIPESYTKMTSLYKRVQPIFTILISLERLYTYQWIEAI